MNTEKLTGHKAQIIRLQTLLKQKTVPNTLLFSGISGIGKRYLALRFLNSLYCKSEHKPCLTCDICKQIEHSTFPDIIQILPDEKGKISIGNGDKPEEGTVRWLINRLSKRSITGNYGIIIDGIEKISISGQNALLKTIEEPQEGTVIILLTANKSQILPTILSRSSKISFNPLSTEELSIIMEQSDIIHDDMPLIADFAGGSIEIASILCKNNMMNNILSLCEDISQCINHENRLSFDISIFQKSIGYDKLLNILLNIYHTLLLTSLSKGDLNSKLHNIAISDDAKTKKLIKIILAMKKGLLNNLNIKISLKGLLYSLNSISEFGTPDLI